MLTIFPYSRQDAAQLISLFRLLDDWGAVQPFGCVLACEEGLDSDEIKALAGRLFRGASVQHVMTYGKTPQTPDGGWPISPNGYFQQVAEAVAANTSEPWFWHEADLMPLMPDYLMQIHADYVRGGKRFYGPVCGTYQRINMERPDLGFRQVSEHLIGTAIYPADYFYSVDGRYNEYKEPLQQSIVRYIVNNSEESRRKGEHVVPFDVFLEAETTPNAHRSTIIQHGWRSRNYREANGHIEFDVDVNYGQDRHIRPGVVLMHGCKDDSLLRIVRRRAGLDGPAIDIQAASAASGASARLQLGGSSAAEQETHNLQVAGSNPACPTEPPAVTMIQVRLGETTVHFSDGSEQRVPMSCVTLPVGEEPIEEAPGPRVMVAPKRRGRAMKKKPVRVKKDRTVEQQAAIDKRMAAMRARRKRK